MGGVGVGRYRMGLNICNVVMSRRFRFFKTQITFRVWYCGCSHSFVSQVVGDGPKTTIVVNMVVLLLYSERHMQRLVA